MANKLTPKQLEEVLKNEGAKTPSHYRDADGIEKERSVSAVVNAFGKTRFVINSSMCDRDSSQQVLEDYYNSSTDIVADTTMVVQKTSVADKIRLYTGKYWTEMNNELTFVSDHISQVGPVSITSLTDPLEITDRNSLGEISAPPKSFMPVFNELIQVSPNRDCVLYDNFTADPITIFERIGEIIVKSSMNRVYEDYSFVCSSPYSLREIERFTSSTNTMYASVDLTYNFFIPEYEAAIIGSENHEPLLPNMYVMMTEMTKERDEAENPWFRKHITLDDSLKMESQKEMMRLPSERSKWNLKNSPAVQYFDMYGRQVNKVINAQKKMELSNKFSNLLFSHASVDSLREHNSRKELFPMYTDIEFSTDSTTEFAQILKESGMSAMLMNHIANDSVTRRNVVEMVSTALQAKSSVVEANEIITQTDIKNESRRVYDVGEWFNAVVSGVRVNPEGIFHTESSIFVGKNNPTEEVTDDPKYALYKSLMSVVFSSKVRDLVRTRTRTYTEMMSGKPAHTETLLYRIEKRVGSTNGRVVQNFWLPNSNDVDVHKFIDSQVKYGTQYTYTIYAYELVFGSRYQYQNLQQTDDSSYIYNVLTEPLLKVLEVPYYRYTNRLMDSPPVMPDIELIPFRAVADKIKINFSSNVGRYDLMPEIIFKGEQRVNELIRKAQDRLPSEPIRYESDDHCTQFEVYRINKHPHSYADFDGEKIKTVLTDVDNKTEHSATSASYVDSIEPNKKYWYTFRSVDNHQHVSYPSPIYEVEMIDDHGSIYPIIKVVDFAPRTPKNVVKAVKRMMQIVPTFSHGVLNEEKSGLTNAVSVADRWDKDTFFLGVEDESLWGKKFKIRLTSRKTGRKIDVNVVFEHKHLKIAPE